MNKLYLITGPAGVGKSTISKLIANRLAKSALVEGDELYDMVKGSYASPWKEGNHLDLMWENSIDIINNFLNKGYDVVFNYIIKNDRFNLLKNKFKNVEIKFVVLMVDEDTIVKRDSCRELDCQMGERSLVLLNEFKKANFDNKYILDTSNLSITETVIEIEKNNRFVV